MIETWRIYSDSKFPLKVMLKLYFSNLLINGLGLVFFMKVLLKKD